MRIIFDDDAYPNPWRPQVGDVYQRQVRYGFKRIVVTVVGSNNAGQQTVHVMMPGAGESHLPCDKFRALLICEGMRPAGRMKTSE